MIFIDLIAFKAIKERECVILAVSFRLKWDNLIEDAFNGRICNILPFFPQSHPGHDDHQHHYAEEVAKPQAWDSIVCDKGEDAGGWDW